MNLDDFTSLILGIVDNEFPTKTIPLTFGISVKLQTDEVNYERHLLLSFEEFLEAFSRIIDRLSPGPEGEEDDWDYSSKQEQHLSQKLVNILPKILPCIKEDYKEVKYKFPTPPKDEYGLFSYDPNSVFYQNIFPKNLHK